MTTYNNFALLMQAEQKVIEVWNVIGKKDPDFEDKDFDFMEDLLKLSKEIQKIAFKWHPEAITNDHDTPKDQEVTQAS